MLLDAKPKPGLRGGFRLRRFGFLDLSLLGCSSWRTGKEELSESSREESKKHHIEVISATEKMGKC